MKWASEVEEREFAIWNRKRHFGVLDCIELREIVATSNKLADVDILLPCATRVGCDEFRAFEIALRAGQPHPRFTQGSIGRTMRIPRFVHSCLARRGLRNQTPLSFEFSLGTRVGTRGTVSRCQRRLPLLFVVGSIDADEWLTCLEGTAGCKLRGDP